MLTKSCAQDCVRQEVVCGVQRERRLDVFVVWCLMPVLVKGRNAGGSLAEVKWCDAAQKSRADGVGKWVSASVKQMAE